MYHHDHDHLSASMKSDGYVASFVFCFCTFLFFNVQPGSASFEFREKEKRFVKGQFVIPGMIVQKEHFFFGRTDDQSFIGFLTGSCHLSLEIACQADRTIFSPQGSMNGGCRNSLPDNLLDF